MKGFRPSHIHGDPSRSSSGSSSARCYLEVRRRILHGEMPAGTLVNEVDLGQALTMSRTPVREALRELLNEGLLDEAPRRQVVVARPDPAAVREAFMMRDSLERLAVRQAASTANTESVDQLRLILIRMSRAAKAQNTAEFLDLDDDFHLQVPRSASLRLVEDVIRRLRAIIRLASLGRTLTTENMTEVIARHERLIDALEEHDPDRAEELTIDHLTSDAAMVKVVVAS